MPTNLTEVDSYDANVSVPVGGDSRTAASVVAAFQALANRAKFLKAHKAGDEGGTFTLATVLKFLGAGVEIGGTGLLVTGPLVAAAGAVLTGGVSIDSAIMAGGQLSGSMAHTSTGRQIGRIAFGGNVDASYGINNASCIYVKNGTLGAHRTYTIVDTGAIVGDEFEIINGDLTYNIVLTIGSGGTTLNGSPNRRYRLKFGDATSAFFTGSKWLPAGASGI